MNALTYLTRQCPRNCLYCDLNKKMKGELKAEYWVDAFNILHELNIEFNLILGNETWAYGNDLIEIIKHNKVPYALYTTCPRHLFLKHWNRFFLSGIDNLSCGIDYSLDYVANNRPKNDMEKKSLDSWRGLLTTRLWYPSVDCQGTITVNKLNYTQLPKIVSALPAAAAAGVPVILRYIPPSVPISIETDLCRKLV